jgi:Na+/H+-dicarboxylate symporter
MHDLEAIIIPLVLFALIFGIVYVAVSARNKERMALIEKGADASIFYSGKKASTGKWILTLGIFAIGVALGIIIGNLLESAGMKEEIAYTSSIFLFSGAALVAAYFIGKKVNGEKE